jgi:hypothetical protein
MTAIKIIHVVAIISVLYIYIYTVMLEGCLCDVIEPPSCANVRCISRMVCILECDTKPCCPQPTCVLNQGLYNPELKGEYYVYPSFY